MSAPTAMRVTAREIFALAQHVAGNPPDGPVTVTTADNGTMHASWTCGGGTASVGPDLAPR